MRRGFTLVEMLVVIALLGIAAAMVIPQMGSIQGLRVQASVRTLVSDLTFAQADAIAFQQRRAVVFDVPNNTYRIVAIPGSTVDPNTNTLYSPSGPGGRYVVDFKIEQFAGARMTATDFEIADTLIFDDMGAPAAGPTGDAPGRGGSVTIVGSDQAFRIVVEPFTGRVTVRKTAGD